MRSIPLAMTWELLHRGRGQLCLAMLGANLLPILILTALRIQGVIDSTDQAFVTLQTLLVWTGILGFGIGILSTESLTTRLYALPVPTSTLVTWRMIPMMVLMGLQSLCSTLILNWLYGLDWPLWGPALFSATALAIVLAVYWYSEKSLLLPFNVSAASVILALWYKSRCGSGSLFMISARYWKIVTIGDVAMLSVCILISYFVANVGVARNRCGEPLGSSRTAVWTESFSSLASGWMTTRNGTFRTCLQAQVWSEWCMKGWAFPTVVAFGLMSGLTVWALFVRDPEQLIVGMVLGGGLLSGAGLLGGLILGNCGSNDTSMDIGPFLGTRPISNADLARTILKVAAQSSVAAWCTWAMAFAIVLALLTLSGVPVGTSLRGVEWWYLPATLLGCWIAVSIPTSITLTGRNQLVLQITCSVVAIAIIAILLSLLLDHETNAWLASLLLVALGIATAGSSLWIMIVAKRGSLITARVVAVMGCVWGLLSIIIVCECLRQPMAQLSAAVFLTGVASLVVAPLAAAPLAVTWNRHR